MDWFLGHFEFCAILWFLRCIQLIWVLMGALRDRVDRVCEGHRSFFLFFWVCAYCLFGKLLILCSLNGDVSSPRW